MQLINKDGRKAIPRLGGTGKNPGGILLMSITTRTYPALIDQGKLDRKVIGQSTVTDGGCKQYTSNTAKPFVKMATCDELQHHQLERRVHQQAAHQARHQ